jgi:3-methyladenine DNA glycosylase Tag
MSAGTPHRCAWAQGDPLLRAYHDEEWGVPEYDSRALWEKLMLDQGFSPYPFRLLQLKRDLMISISYGAYFRFALALLGD